MRLKKTWKYFFFKYLVALCLSFRKYSILTLRIVSLRDTILQTYLVERTGLWHLESGLWTMCICEVTGVGG